VYPDAVLPGGLPRRVFRAGSLDLVTSIASGDHMDVEAALRRMPELLRPGGVLVVAGLARDSVPGGLGAAGSSGRRLEAARHCRPTSRDISAAG
jgi:SAM-dependent methyltransferase